MLRRRQPPGRRAWAVGGVDFGGRPVRPSQDCGGSAATSSRASMCWALFLNRGPPHAQGLLPRWPSTTYPGGTQHRRHGLCTSRSTPGVQCAPRTSARAIKAVGHLGESIGVNRITVLQTDDSFGAGARSLAPKRALPLPTSGPCCCKSSRATRPTLPPQLLRVMRSRSPGGAVHRLLGHSSQRREGIARRRLQRPGRSPCPTTPLKASSSCWGTRPRCHRHAGVSKRTRGQYPLDQGGAGAGQGQGSQQHFASPDGRFAAAKVLVEGLRRAGSQTHAHQPTRRIGGHEQVRPGWPLEVNYSPTDHIGPGVCRPVHHRQRRQVPSLKESGAPAP